MPPITVSYCMWNTRSILVSVTIFIPTDSDRSKIANLHSARFLVYELTSPWTAFKVAHYDTRNPSEPFELTFLLSIITKYNCSMQ